MEEFLQNKKGSNLLTLPRCDVGLSMPDNVKTDDANDRQGAVAPSTSYPSLLLLQLPEKYKVQDLKDARFVIPNTTTKQQQQSASAVAASLIVEGAETSFALQRVETSNALVLVPPRQRTTTTTTTTTTAQDVSTTNYPPSSKRRKIVDSIFDNDDNNKKALQVVQARLLHKGVGAFFLEPKTVPCRLADLRAHLPVWDGLLSPTTTAVSLVTLSNSLAKSRTELRVALRTLQAVNTGNDNFVRLTEECRLDVLDAVLATLVEAYPHYVKEGIAVTQFISSARLRLPTVLQNDENSARVLVRYMLSTLTDQYVVVSEKDNDDDKPLFLQVERVGAAVASRILTRQAEWEESLLLARWQTEMPGVDVTVSTAWLTGHAVRLAVETSTNDNNKNDKAVVAYHWKYLPAVAVVETDTSAVVWERLVHAQPEWTAQDLKPYLDAWNAYTGQAPATILKHAAMRQVEGGLTVYFARLE